MIFDNKTILITGGTGSLGKELTKTILQRYPTVKKIIIYTYSIKAFQKNNA